MTCSSMPWCSPLPISAALVPLGEETQGNTARLGAHGILNRYEYLACARRREAILTICSLGNTQSRQPGSLSATHWSAHVRSSSIDYSLFHVRSNRTRTAQAMAIYEQMSVGHTTPSPQRMRDLPGLIRSLGRRMAVGLRACADYCAAAAMYDHLRGLSDAELRKRGLWRETLAWDRHDRLPRE